MSKLVIIGIREGENVGKEFRNKGFTAEVRRTQRRSYNTEIHGGNTEFHREIATVSKEEVRLKNGID